MECLAADVSLPETCSFEELLVSVAQSRAIVTTRLHVAILGCFFEIPTCLVDGAYHKFRGGFELSLQNRSVTLLDWDPVELRLSCSLP